MIINCSSINMNADVSFLIVDYSFQEGGVIQADGNVTHGVLRVGDFLNTLHNYIFVDEENIELLDEKEIFVKVKEINYYRKSIDELEAGYSARVFFVGEISENDFVKYPKKSRLYLTKKTTIN